MSFPSTASIALGASSFIELHWPCSVRKRRCQMKIKKYEDFSSHFQPQICKLKYVLHFFVNIHTFSIILYLLFRYSIVCQNKNCSQSQLVRDRLRRAFKLRANLSIFHVRQHCTTIWSVNSGGEGWSRGERSTLFNREMDGIPPHA